MIYCWEYKNELLKYSTDYESNVVRDFSEIGLVLKLGGEIESSLGLMIGLEWVL